MIVSLMTLITNKPHPLAAPPPILCSSVVLVGVAIATRRWLTSSPDGAYAGFTAPSSDVTNDL